MPKRGPGPHQFTIPTPLCLRYNGVSLPSGPQKKRALGDIAVVSTAWRANPRRPSRLPLGRVRASNSGLDPRPFAMAMALAASASLLTPIGYQTNSMVWGLPLRHQPGYRRPIGLDHWLGVRLGTAGPLIRGVQAGGELLEIGLVQVTVMIQRHLDARMPKMVLHSFDVRAP